MKKSRKAQQLVEFVLVAPVIMAILVVIVEIGYAINTKISLGESIKSSIPALNQLYNQSNTEAAKLELVRSTLETSIKGYFDSHNLPNSDSISVSITEPANSQTAVVTAIYSYEPVFKLPNLFNSQLIPDKYTFSSSQVISKSLLSAGTFNSPLSTYDLSSFGKTNGNLDSRTSALINSTIDGIDFRSKLAILLSFKTTNGDSAYKYARLVNWWGEDLLPQNELIDITTGTLAIKSPYYNGGNWFDSKVPYTWAITALGFTQAIFTKTDLAASGNPIYNGRRLLFSSSDFNDNLGVSWCDQGASYMGTCSGDVSGTTLDNYGKRGLSLFYDTSNDAYGTFDNAVWSTTTAASDPKYVKSAVYTNAANNFILRLFIPNNAVAPTDSQNGYKSSFSIDNNGQLAAAGTAVNIQDLYLDNDGDSIPNAWDKDPEYIDIDGNDKIDGTQASVLTKVTDLPTAKTTAQLAVGQSYDSTVNGNVICSGASTAKVYYKVTANSAVTFAADSIIVPYRMASPFTTSGAAKVSTLKTPYVPSFDNVDLNKVTFNKITRTAGNPCTEVTQALGTFIYYNTNNNLYRKMPSWIDNPAPLMTYFYNMSTGIKELDQLNQSAFINKVSQTR
ncbi:MAG: TadE family protein [bacterium]